MMIFSNTPLERIWDNILSCKPSSIQATFSSLTSDDQTEVLVHLQRMVSEHGWLPQQRHAAQVALMELKKIKVVIPDN